MHKRKRRVLSLILVTILLINSMTFGRVAEEFSVLRACGKSPVLCHRFYQSDINDAAVCTAEVFSLCGQLGRQSIKLDSQLFLLYADDTLLYAGKSCRYLETVRSLWNVSDEWVVDYIHQSDGKKRNAACHLHIIK